jgi:acetylglutamate kinase
VQAVGLTGADAKVGLVRAAAPHQSVDGQVVDLGRVGVPADDAPKRLLDALLIEGFVPVVACIGVDDRGELFNVNADILAAHLAARLSARRLVIAGTTAGVLDAGGRTLPLLDTAAIERLVRERTATAGMIAKLRACEHALSAVEDVVIVDGRDASALVSAATPGNVTLGSATRLVRMVTA